MSEFLQQLDVKDQERVRLVVDLLNQLKGWSEEKPDEIIHSTSPNPENKYRLGWFSNIISSSYILQNMKFLSENTLNKVEELKSIIFQDSKNGVQHITTEDEIALGNEIIDQILAEVEGLE